MAYAVPPENDPKLCGTCRPRVAFTLGEAAYVGGFTPRPELRTIPTTNKERGWWWNVCDCCKWSWHARAQSNICDMCTDHDRSKPCELACATCGRPTHEHPVVTPTMHCAHNGVMIINPNLKMRFC